MQITQGKGINLAIREKNTQNRKATSAQNGTSMGKRKTRSVDAWAIKVRIEQPRNKIVPARAWEIVETPK